MLYTSLLLVQGEGSGEINAATTYPLNEAKLFAQLSSNAHLF